MRARSPDMLDLVLVLCGVACVVFYGQACVRVPWPFELEWMEGGMLTHAARLLTGQSIYAEPSTDFVPYFYTPLYPALLAGLSFLTGGLSFALGRGVSLAFTTLTLFLLYRIASRETGSGRYGLLAAGLYAASFRFTGAFFDLARPDAMFIALVLSAVYVARYVPGYRGVVLSACLFVLGHFTKQTTSVFVPAVALWLAFRSLPQAGVFAGTAALGGVLGTWALDGATDGWFWRYIFEGHQGHLFYWKNILMEYWRDVLFLAPLFLILPLLWFRYRVPVVILSVFLAVHWLYAFFFRARTLDYVPHMYYQELWYESPRWAILVPPAALAVLAGVHWARNRERKLTSDPFLLVLFMAGVGSSGLNHSTQWAYANCFMPIAAFAALLVAKATAELAPLRASGCVHAMLALQLLAFAWDPRAEVPNDEDRAALNDLNARLDAYPGPLFAPAHPFLTWTRERQIHVHQMGIQDVAFMGGLKDLEPKLAARTWGAVLVDEQTTIPGLAKYYREAERLRYPGPNTLRARTGFRVRPVSIWVPKR
jgi:hypothetical protein